MYFELTFSFRIYNRGIPVISKDRRPRMEAIAKELAKGQFDIVCLQEVWSNSDYDFITENAKAVLPYAHYFFRYL